METSLLVMANGLSCEGLGADALIKPRILVNLDRTACIEVGKPLSIVDEE
jgi:hypothetical protein